jgi:hypothetical protein
MDYDTFMKWERSTHETIYVKKAYVDICGDLTAGVLLSRIIYWFTPNQKGEPKVRVKKEGHWWLARADGHWHNEIRLTEKQAMTARGKLTEKGFIITKTFRFNKTPMTHYRLNEQILLKALQERLDIQQKQPANYQTSSERKNTSQERRKIINVNDSPQAESRKQYDYTSDSPNGKSRGGGASSEVRLVMRYFLNEVGINTPSSEANKVRAKVEQLLRQGKSVEEVKRIVVPKFLEDEGELLLTETFEIKI